MTHRGRRAHPAALRGRGARVGRHQPGQRRAQELAPVGGRRLRPRPRGGTRETPDHLYLGHRGRPNEILQRGAELMNRDRRRRGEPAWRTRRGLRRHVPRALPRGLRGGPRRRTAGPTGLCHVRGRPSRDARRRRHRRAAPARAAGWMAPCRSTHDEEEDVKLGFLTAPFPDTPLMDVADWAAVGRLRGPRRSPAGRARSGTARKYAGTSHIDVDDLSRASATEIRARDRGQGPGHLRPRLLPQPAAPGPGRCAPPPSTISRRSSWPPGRMGLPGHEHVLRRRRQQARRRQLGGGAARLAGHRALRAGPGRARSPSRTAP